MAFIDVAADGTKSLTFYNVTFGVGAGGRNWEEDVKIVQFFLKRIYSLPKYQKMKPWGEMVVDGKSGPITRAWIAKFQADATRNGIPMRIDGKIDKAGNAHGNYVASFSGTYYAIRILNNMMYTQDQQVYKNLTTHPEVPADVRAIFQQIHAQGPQMVYENPLMALNQ